MSCQQSFAPEATHCSTDEESLLLLFSLLICCGCCCLELLFSLMILLSLLSLLLLLVVVDVVSHLKIRKSRKVPKMSAPGFFQAPVGPGDIFRPFSDCGAGGPERLA